MIQRFMTSRAIVMRLLIPDRLIQSVLQEHSEIQMVLDIHRDGLQDKPENYTRAEVGGEPVAKILFVIGDKDMLL